MQLNQLTNFLMTAKLNSVTKAAASMFLTQPAMTKSIAALEKELGVKLFDRTGKKVSVSAAGQRILPHVQSILDEVGKIKDICSTFDEAQPQVTFTASVIALYITELVSSFKKYQPDIEIVHQRPVQGDSDIIIDMTTENDFSGGRTCLLREDLVLIVPTKHPLAGKSEIDLIELAGYPIMSFSEVASLRHAEDYFCAQAGFTPRREKTMETHIDLFNAIHDESGVVFNPAKTGGIDSLGSNRIIRLTNPDCYRYVYAEISQDAQDKAAVKLFHDHIVTFFSQF